MKLLNRRLGLVLIILALTALTVQAGAIKVYFKSEVTINSERMYLGEIAQVEGEGKLVDKLRQIDLGPAPRPNKSLTLPRDMILSIVIKQGVNLQDIEVINLTPKGVVVHRAGQLLEQKIVFDKLTDYIHSQLPDFSGEIQVLPKGIFPETWLPLGDYQLEVVHRPNNKFSGFNSIPVKIVIDGKEYTKIYVNTDIRVYDTVVLTMLPIERGTVITSEMVEERFIDTTEVNGAFFSLKEHIIGKMAKRSIAKNAVVLQEYIEIPKLIRRNDEVAIEVSYGAIRIQVKGKALQDGALGEIIEVENISSGIKIKAQVTGAGTVLVKVD